MKMSMMCLEGSHVFYLLGVRALDDIQTVSLPEIKVAHRLII